MFCAVPVWITEIVSPKYRGVLVDMHPILINVGYCLSSVSLLLQLRHCERNSESLGSYVLTVV